MRPSMSTTRKSPSRYPRAMNALFWTNASDVTAFPNPLMRIRLFLWEKNVRNRQAEEQSVAVAIAHDGGVGEKQKGGDGDVAEENATHYLDVVRVVGIEHSAAADAGEAGVFGVETDVPERDGEAAIVDEAAMELGGPELDGSVERAGEKVLRVAREVEVGNDIGMTEKKEVSGLRRGGGAAPEMEEAVFGGASDLRWKEEKMET